MAEPVKYHYGEFPPKRIDWEKLIPLIGPANAELARYDGALSAVPNPDILLTPLTTQEAVLSSKIEGTQATMGEVLEYEAQQGDIVDLSPERKADIFEVLNYRKAIWQATELLQKLPLCERVIREAHKVLLHNVRGHNKAPGEYRKFQNWIGVDGTVIEKARFVPISPERLPDGMKEWEKYIHRQEPDKLVQLAILHAEFEALHPFLDGNGRIGRMFVPLFLYKMGLIQSPMFYISAFFETNREEYYERLLAVSRDRNWTGWCEFFLIALKAQAKENQQKTSAILKLYESKKKQIHEAFRSLYAGHALDLMFERPIFKTSDLTRGAQISEPTAKRIISELRNTSIIKVLREGKGRRSTIYVFAELINIAEGKTIF